MSISKKQLDALNRGLIQKLGITDSPDLNTGGLMGEILQGIADGVIDALQQQLRQKDLKASSALIQSIDPTPAVMVADGVSVKIVMADYWERVEEGTTPQQFAKEIQKVGIERKLRDLEEWISAKGIRPNKRKGQSVMQARRSLAYAIAMKIGKKGTIKRFGYKGGDFIKDVLTPQNIDLIATHISELAGKKIELFIVAQ